MGFEKFASPPPIARITWPVSGQKITQKTNGKNRIRQAEMELYQAQTIFYLASIQYAQAACYAQTLLLLI